MYAEKTVKEGVWTVETSTALNSLTVGEGAKLAARS